MPRTCWLLGVALGVTLAAGCAPSAQQRDTEFRLHKAEQERDGLQRGLSEEQARNAALQKRLEVAEAEVRTTQAQLASLQELNTKLAKAQDSLQSIVEETKGRAVKRPDIAASPLPDPTDEALQALVGRFRERLWYDRGRGAVSFANDRLFDSGSDAVRADAQASLNELAGILARPELADYEVIVVGHTDATPITKAETLAKHPSNWHLSVHRAIAVKDMLVKAGLPAARLGVMGYADNRPVGGDPAQNRRVEVFIVRKGGVQPFDSVTPGGTR